MAPPTHPEPSLDAVEQEHVRIAATLRAHQEALVRAVGQPRAGEEARALLLTLDKILRAHIRVEDERLIPVFVERCSPATGCTPEILRAEHRKLERLLGEAAAGLDEALEDDGTVAPGAVLDLIERERSLREVLEHHDQRERAAFFPALREVMTPAEQEALLA